MNEDRVQARLRELRESMADMSAPENVEAAVMAAFRERAPVRRVSPVWRWAMAACLALVAGLAGWRWMKPEEMRIVVVAPPRSPLMKPVIPALPPASPVASAVKPGRIRSQPVVRPGRGHRGAVRRQESSPAAVESAPGREAEEAAAFVPLPFAPPVVPSDDQQVVRVRIPRGAMRQFGVVVREDRVREPVQADFLLGQDGVARAVRLVNNTQ